MPCPLMVTLLLVTDLSWASNILVRSIVSASNERNGAPSGNNPKTFQRSCEVGKRVVRHVEFYWFDHAHPADHAWQGQGSGSRQSTNRGQRSGLRRFFGSAALPLVDCILPR